MENAATKFCSLISKPLAKNPFNFGGRVVSLFAPVIENIILEQDLLQVGKKKSQFLKKDLGEKQLRKNFLILDLKSQRIVAGTAYAARCQSYMRVQIAGPGPRRETRNMKLSRACSETISQTSETSRKVVPGNQLCEFL